MTQRKLPSRYQLVGQISLLTLALKMQVSYKTLVVMLSKYSSYWEFLLITLSITVSGLNWNTWKGNQAPIQKNLKDLIEKSQNLKKF